MCAQEEMNVRGLRCGAEEEPEFDDGKRRCDASRLNREPDEPVDSTIVAPDSM